MNGSRILLVDDEPESRSILAAWLRQLGVEVTEAGDIAMAESALDAATFDLILSDVHLPGNNRLQWTERVLARPEIAPLVLLTGNPEVTTAIRAANLPVAGYLSKPPDFPVLQDLIQQFINRHRRQRGLREVAREAARLAGEADPAHPVAPALGRKLGQLADCLATEALHPSRELSDGNALWRRTIADTIAVLEKTRDSFRSKELGRLRAHLKQLLDQKSAA